MIRYIFGLFLLIYPLLASQKVEVSDKQIEKMVLAVLEPVHSPEKVVSKPVGKRSHTLEKSGQFYVQMGAFKKNSRPSALIGKLKEFGYRPLLKTALRNHEQYHLLLIGPYKSRAAVENSLRILRAVKPDAFICYR